MTRGIPDRWCCQRRHPVNRIAPIGAITSHSVSSLPPPNPGERIAFNPAHQKLGELTHEPDLTVLKRKRRKRVSRWDRPPEPRDWRWVVGNIGKLFITLGLLMFGFVAYQLWGTGIQEARAQDNLRGDLNNYFDQQGIVPDTLAPETSPVTTSPAVTTGDSTAGTDSSVTTTSPTVVSVPSSIVPIAQELPKIEQGSAIGFIKIPKIGLSKAIVAGVGVKDLQKGPGHFPNTPFPGQLGNVAVAGHRTTYGGPFLDVDELQPGDDIIVTTILGDVYLYKVTGSEVVGKNDYHVITDSDPTKATLTLITCTPIGTASHRLVIHSELQVDRSSQVGEAVINYGQDFVPGPDNTLPVDEPASSVAEGTPSSTPSSTVGSTPSAGSVPAAVAGGADLSDGTDAFNQGWFADSAAWPHVAAWGFGLLVLWYLAYRLAKRYRRLWLGFIVGVAPFVVLLYFFYENINRLLPTAI